MSLSARIGSAGPGAARLEGAEKLTGTARYAGEVTPAVQGGEPDPEVAFAWPVQATIGVGRIRAFEFGAAEATEGVLSVLTPDNAPRLRAVDDKDVMVLQGHEVAYRGQVIALVVATSEETARAAAESVRVSYDEGSPDVVLTGDHPGLYAPEKVNPSFPTDTRTGDVDAALGEAAVTVDATYTTPALHNNAMEPHTSTARWDGDRLTVWDSTQGTTSVRNDLATLFDIARENVRVRAEHVGGGFGSKGSARVNVVLAVMAARVVGCPVRLALSRQAMFSLVGYRTPTIQRVRLGAHADGRLTAIAHEAIEQTSTVFEFAEQTVVATRTMYSAANRRTSHRLVRLDVPTPRWMRAPGECPGMFALESAMDELAVASGLDPIELRIRNEPDRDPESGQPFSSRHLVECLQEGAKSFGWTQRPADTRREGHLLVGCGVAASTYPAYTSPAGARARAEADGTFTVAVNATDIGTGARTVLRSIAADALSVPVERVRIEIADSDLPPAPVAGGSAGTSSWGWAVTKACTELCEVIARGGFAGRPEVTVDTKADVEARKQLARHAYGAQFAEVAVNEVTGEVRLRRLLGVFGVGRILNARTARSQLLGGMTMGASMALLEEGRMEAHFGDYLNHDLASYHVATAADVPLVEAHWFDEQDGELNPMGSKGIGEIGIVGTAAAIANAVFDATGVRVRDLPIRLDRLVTAFEAAGR